MPRKIVDDYKNEKGEWVGSRGDNISGHITRSRVIFNMIHARCDPNGYHQKAEPTYVGCYTSENFKDFQFFAKWCQTQTGYGLDDYEIDKDILIVGNKCYSEDTCVFVPNSLNAFLILRTNDRGDFPLGVTKSKTRKTMPYRARLSISGKRIHLGYFDNELQAFSAYKAAKEQEAMRWYHRLTNKEYIVDERVISAMFQWKLTRMY